jgi:hypothetical protein
MTRTPPFPQSEATANYSARYDDYLKNIFPNFKKVWASAKVSGNLNKNISFAPSTRG